MTYMTPICRARAARFREQGNSYGFDHGRPGRNESRQTTPGCVGSIHDGPSFRSTAP